MKNKTNSTMNNVAIMKRLIGVFALSVLFLHGCTSDFKITENKEIVIFLPVNPGETEKFAAAELSKYLEQITGNKKIEVLCENKGGKRPGMKIFVGQTIRGGNLAGELSGEDAEAFIIAVRKNRLMLRGNCDRSTLYSVYTLLEQFGCRWLAPGIDHVPQKEIISMKAGSQVHSPGIKFRVLRYLVIPGSSEWRMKCVDWAVKNKINMIADKKMETLFPEEIMKRGGPRGINNSHIPRNILTNDLFKKQPEVFARIGNPEESLELPVHNRQFCFSEEKSLSLYAEKMIEYIGCHPEVELFPLTQGDGNHYCMCDNCKKLYSENNFYRNNMPFVTKAWMTFAGKVAGMVKQTWPDKKFYTLAYHRTSEPVDMDDFKIHSDIIVVIVHHPVSFDQLRKYSEPENKSFLELYNRWSLVSPGGVGIYDYYPHTRFKSFPLVAVEKVVADIQTACNLKSLYFEIQSLTSPGMYLPVYYAGGKAMWNPDVDIEKEMDLFYQGMFGSSAVHMKEFFQVLEEARSAYPHPFDPAEGGLPFYISKEVAAKAEIHLTKAFESAASDEIHERIQPLADHFFYAKHLIYGRDAFASYEKSGDIHFLEEAVYHGDEIVKLTVDAQNSRGIRYDLGMISSARDEGPGGLFAEPGEWKNTLINVRGNQP